MVFVDDDDDNNNNNNTKLLITVTLNMKLQGHITQLINIKKHLKQMLHGSRSQLRPAIAVHCRLLIMEQ